MTPQPHRQVALGSVFDIQPSGRTLIEEIQGFASRLDPAIGPMFGRDVVRLCEETKALRRRVEVLEP